MSCIRTDFDLRTMGGQSSHFMWPQPDLIEVPPWPIKIQFVQPPSFLCRPQVQMQKSKPHKISLIYLQKSQTLS